MVSRNLKALLKMVQEVSNPSSRFIIVADDTLMRKHGASADNCYWFDHCLNCTYKGRNYLALVLVDTLTNQHFPLLNYLLYSKKHPKYKPRIEVLKMALRRLKAQGFGDLTLVADSWFAAKALFTWLHRNKWTFEIEIKGNRKAFLSKKCGQQKGQDYSKVRDVLSTLPRKTAYSGRTPKLVSGHVLFLFKCFVPLKCIAVWNTGQDNPFAFYATNNKKLQESRIWALSRFRWTIESCFRTAKQSVCFDAFQVKDSAAAYRLVTLSFLFISWVERERFQPDAKPVPISKRNKQYGSFCSIAC